MDSRKDPTRPIHREMDTGPALPTSREPGLLMLLKEATCKHCASLLNQCSKLIRDGFRTFGSDLLRGWPRGKCALSTTKRSDPAHATRDRDAAEILHRNGEYAAHAWYWRRLLTIN